MLGVHPEYQRLGAGKALVEWGTKAADEQGVKVRNSLFFPPSVIPNPSELLTRPPSLIPWIAINLCGQAVVEGTPVGRHLYEHCGLSAEIEEMRFDVGQEFAGRRIPKLIYLTREPRT